MMWYSDEATCRALYEEEARRYEEACAVGADTLLLVERAERARALANNLRDIRYEYTPIYERWVARVTAHGHTLGWW